jgi:hypothetical protein
MLEREQWCTLKNVNTSPKDSWQSSVHLALKDHILNDIQQRPRLHLAQHHLELPVVMS